MNFRNIIITSITVCLIFFCFYACSNNGSEANSSEISTDNTFKEQMDIAMKNADDSKVLALVNNVKIKQTNIDVYLISGENYTTEDIVKFVIIEDYAKNNNLKITQNAQDRIDSMRRSMEEDQSLTDEYCLKTYGISKKQVIEYMVNRSYQIEYNSAFSDMVIEQVSSGECPKLYPCLQEAYNKFEKDKLSKGSKAWDDIEQAYYDMIAKDYEVVINWIVVLAIGSVVYKPSPFLFLIQQLQEYISKIRILCFLYQKLSNGQRISPNGLFTNRSLRKGKQVLPGTHNS